MENNMKYNKWLYGVDSKGLMEVWAGIDTAHKCSLEESRSNKTDRKGLIYYYFLCSCNMLCIFCMCSKPFSIMVSLLVLFPPICPLKLRLFCFSLPNLRKFRDKICKIWEYLCNKASISMFQS